jgi:hypothetical protein
MHLPSLTWRIDPLALAHPQLPPASKLVLIWIDNRPPGHPVSIAQASAELGLGGRTVGTALERLESAGLLRITGRPAAGQVAIERIQLDPAIAQKYLPGFTRAEAPPMERQAAAAADPLAQILRGAESAQILRKPEGPPAAGLTSDPPTPPESDISLKSRSNRSRSEMGPTDGERLESVIRRHGLDQVRTWIRALQRQLNNPRDKAAGRTLSWRVAQTVVVQLHLDPEVRWLIREDVERAIKLARRHDSPIRYFLGAMATKFRESGRGSEWPHATGSSLLYRG